MLNLKKVAVTGGLACGKSTVCQLLEELGARVVSADLLVHELFSPQSKIGQKLVELLGKEVVLDGEFDRQAIAEKAFKDKSTLTALENLLHPAVFERIEEEYEKSDAPLFVAEVPLLYEADKAHLFDIVVAVIADSTKAKKRFATKTLLPTSEFTLRMTHQLPLEQKSAHADITIENDGTLEELKTKTIALYTQLTR